MARRRHGMKSKKTNKSSLIKVKEDISELKAQQRAEMGQLHSSISALTAVSDTGTVGGFFGPVVGPDEDDRLGDVLRVKKLWTRWNFVASDTTNVMRLIIFKWKPDNAVDAPSTASILESARLGLPAINCISSYISIPADRKKFTVLLDRCFPLTTSGSNQSVVFTRTFGVKKLGNVQYNGSATVTGTGLIFYLVVSDSGAVSHPQYRMSCVTDYTK